MWGKATQHLTVADLAERWQCTRNWVRVMAASGQIPGALKLGSRWRFPVAAVEAYENRHTTSDPMSLTPRAAARAKW